MVSKSLCVGGWEDSDRRSVSLTLTLDPLTTSYNSANTSLRGCTLSSPPSTVLLSQDKLSQIRDTRIQRSIAIQILRFVSPHPWGSHAAEGFRKSESLDRIISAVFDKVPNGDSTGRTAFSAGSHVLWTPIYVRPDGQIKHTKPISSADGWTEGWLASRSPPYRTASGALKLELDITSFIVDRRSSADPIEILYDNRFVLTFHPRAIPGEVFERLCVSPSSGQRLLVTATNKYFLPRLTFRLSNGDAIEDAAMGGSGSSPNMLSMTNMLGSFGTFVGADWANWRLARLLE